MQEVNLSEVYPLSKNNKVQGTRRLAREKALQAFIAYSVSETILDDLISHIYFRIFNFEAGEDVISEKLLKPDEIHELEADIPIVWREDTLQFAKDLLHNTIKNSIRIDEWIKKFIQKWDMERIALIDNALIKIAVTEFIDFPDIPPKVSINEAIDISKMYSTDKSKDFINGILDSIKISLSKDGIIKKQGRGLINH